MAVKRQPYLCVASFLLAQLLGVCLGTAPLRSERKRGAFYVVEEFVLVEPPRWLGLCPQYQQFHAALLALARLWPPSPPQNTSSNADWLLPPLLFTQLWSCARVLCRAVCCTGLRCHVFPRCIHASSTSVATVTAPAAAAAIPRLFATCRPFVVVHLFLWLWLGTD